MLISMGNLLVLLVNYVWLKFFIFYFLLRL
jgi:hypothetical protein